MVFKKNIYVIVLWTKVASAFDGFKLNKVVRKFSGRSYLLYMLG